MEVKYFMIYIGNFKNWINSEILNIILNTPGELRPLSHEIKNQKKHDTVEKWLNAGYDLKKLSWQFFYQEHVGNLLPPFDINGRKYKWWFSKLSPGDIFPLHIDSFPDNEQDIERYWVACQDCEPGHIFVYDNKILEYKAGDMYQFNEARDWHGAANIGFIPKVSYQLVIFNQ